MPACLLPSPLRTLLPPCARRPLLAHARHQLCLGEGPELGMPCPTKSGPGPRLPPGPQGRQGGGPVGSARSPALAHGWFPGEA